MNIAADPDYRRVFRWIENQEAQFRGQNIDVIRPILAFEMGIAPGTLENVRRGRFKALKGCVERAIDAALVRLLSRQQMRIERELELAATRSGGADRCLRPRALAARDALDALIDEAWEVEKI